MKKLIATLTIALFSISAFAGGPVNQKVLDAFNSEFSTATEVQWTIGENYYKATFNYNGKYVFAFYDESGELMGLTRNLSPVDLPIALQTNLKKNYAGFWVSELFEAVKTEDTNYYITVENADTKLTLKSEGNSWTVYKRIRKS